MFTVLIPNDMHTALVAAAEAKGNTGLLARLQAAPEGCGPEREVDVNDCWSAVSTLEALVKELTERTEERIRHSHDECD